MKERERKNLIERENVEEMFEERLLNKEIKER